MVRSFNSRSLRRGWTFPINTAKQRGSQTNRIVEYGLLALFTGILALLTYTSLSAHGGGTPRMTNVEAGPYRLFAWTSPEPLRAGEVHMTIAVTLGPSESQSDEQSGSQFDTLTEAVRDVTINVVFKPLVVKERPPNQLSGETVSLLAEASEMNPLYYEVDTELAFAGQWEATLSVEGTLGSGQASFTSDVEPARLVNWSLVSGVILLFVIIILFSRMRNHT